MTTEEQKAIYDEMHQMELRLMKDNENKHDDVIEKSPDQLSKVQGIGSARVSMVKEAWEAQREIKNVMILNTNGMIRFAANNDYVGNIITKQAL